MPAVLIDYLADEPISFADFEGQSRVDGDEEQAHITGVVIPAARQTAETRSGAAIRPGRYRERLPGFPPTDFPLSIGQVTEIESVQWRASEGDFVTLSTNAYELLDEGRESRLAPAPGFSWPHAVAVLITYKAGTDLEKHPSVRQWLLLAAAWMFEHRELYGTQSIVEMPQGYADGLLAPITVLPRF
ncbi:hypothetical protein P3W85_29955 [Cupriavidus basilensis]|uniref:Phage gp6-like head-tail connector protein n=1 Tax=Cupriavidus basilensis TaxID=68895 RepID=A0ABT6AXR2_9BURK|nr:hypothetical protein [Cupriavidus basilensis]MDF3837148.1 hypothetical protein [Cupriavidus basilensis]